ncbi:MAG: Uma2 family endonuclease, partial [Chloroflexota bacterium]
MAATALLTADELLALPESEQGELIRGDLQPMSPNSFDHALLTGRLNLALLLWARDTGAGTVGNELGFILAHDPDTVLAPDIFFLTAARVPARGTPGFLALAPDLAVEVLSPSNSASAILEKVRIYLGAGVRLVWIVDPETNTLTEYPAGAAPRSLTAADTLDGGDVLPGFSLELEPLFG